MKNDAVEAERSAEGKSGSASTTTSTAVSRLLSSRASALEAADLDRKLLDILRQDADLSATVVALESVGDLRRFAAQVSETAARRELCQMLGSRLNARAAASAETHVAMLGLEWELQFNLGRLGVSSAAPPFNAASYSFLISSSPSAPFTGSGATGLSETNLSIPMLDKALLALHHRPTRAWYSNPISNSPAYDGLPAYLAALTPVHRVQQARLLLGLPINSVMKASYAGCIPSRMQVVKAASEAHGLHPDLLGAFLLAEQRDQSRNEDAAEYIAATSPLRADTSIGLGQVRVLTVRQNDLFADLLSPGTRRGLSHKKIANLLVSEEFNIFAVARYLRKVADAGSKINRWKLPNTLATFPSLNMADYAKNSSFWSPDNIRAIASKYTSNPWDDRPVKGWGDFVLAALRDVRSSGWFARESAAQNVSHG